MIKALHEDINYSLSQIPAEFPNRQWKKTTVAYFSWNSYVFAVVENVFLEVIVQELPGLKKTLKLFTPLSRSRRSTEHQLKCTSCFKRH